MGKICTKCGLEKPESEFATQKTVKSGLRAMCKTCGNAQRREWYKRNKEKADQITFERRLHKRELLERLKTSCRKCGEQRAYVIQFHHIDSDNKAFNIGDNGCYTSEERLKDEVKKCVCLCANCHFEFHYLYGKQPTNSKVALEEYLGEDIFSESKGIERDNSDNC